MGGQLPSDVNAPGRRPLAGASALARMDPPLLTRNDPRRTLGEVAALARELATAQR